MLNFLNSGIGLIVCLALIGLAIVVKLVGTALCAAYVLDSKQGLATKFRHLLLGAFGVGSVLFGWFGALCGSLGATISIVLLILTYVKHH